jgi:hypothetical protein
MATIVVFQITSLHARTVQQAGLKIRYQGKDYSSGVLAANLDVSAAHPANIGVVNLKTGAIKIRWSAIATVPFLADAAAQGLLSAAESAPVRIWFEESGHVGKNARTFNIKGPGGIHAGSIFSAAPVSCANVIAMSGGGGSFIKKMAAGKRVHCSFDPNQSTIKVKLPAKLGGTSQSQNLIGGFSAEPVLAL